MTNKQKTIDFTTDDGKTIPFYVVEHTTIAGIDYILVTDSEDEEAEAYILREIKEINGEGVFEMVSDDQELNAVSKVFVELLDDVDIEVEK